MNDLREITGWHSCRQGHRPGLPADQRPVSAVCVRGTGPPTET
jgi:hypothetical protein